MAVIRGSFEYVASWFVVDTNTQVRDAMGALLFAHCLANYTLGMLNPRTSLPRPQQHL